MDVMNLVRKTHPSRDEVASIQPCILKFYNHATSRFPGSSGHYLHILRDHIGPLAEHIYDKWGIGLGFFSTQASEHGNKLAKSAMRYTSGFIGQGDHKKNMFDMHMRDRLVRLLHFTDTIRQHKQVLSICGRCGDVGHRKSNRRACPLHPSRFPPPQQEDDGSSSITSTAEV